MIQNPNDRIANNSEDSDTTRPPTHRQDPIYWVLIDLKDNKTAGNCKSSTQRMTQNQLGSHKSGKTSREWHKLAPNLRLTNSKRTSKCQVISSIVFGKPKSWTELVQLFGFFSMHSVAKKLKGSL